MLATMCGEFKAYHCLIVAGLETDETAVREQLVLDEHQKKSVEFIDRLWDLLAQSQLDIPSPLSTNNLLVNGHLDLPEDSARGIRRAGETPSMLCSN